MVRAGITMFAGSGVLALLPALARSLSTSPTVFGVLLGCFGTGAVLGGIAMPAARSRWSLEAVAAGAVVILGTMIVSAGVAHHLALLAMIMLVAGGGWIVFISLVGALVQALAPDWARARVLAVFVLLTQGGLAAGSAVWGATATRLGLSTALLIAGISTIVTVVLGRVAELPETTVDMTPWNHWRLPAIVQNQASAQERGPVLVTVRYRVSQEHAIEFLAAMRTIGLIRRRDGASQWDLFRDVEQADAYLETFMVTSWAEHVRQHGRFTRGDEAAEARVRELVEEEPTIRHLVHADLNR